MHNIIFDMERGSHSLEYQIYLHKGVRSWFPSKESEIVDPPSSSTTKPPPKIDCLVVQNASTWHIELCKLFVSSWSSECDRSCAFSTTCYLCLLNKWLPLAGPFIARHIHFWDMCCWVNLLIESEINKVFAFRTIQIHNNRI